MLAFSTTSGAIEFRAREGRSQLRGLRSNLALSDSIFLIDLSDQSHLPRIGVSHNDDFVVAFTELDKPLPRTDWCFCAEAIVFVVAAVRNVDFSHHVRLLGLNTYSRTARRQPVSLSVAIGGIGIPHPYDHNSHMEEEPVTVHSFEVWDAREDGYVAQRLKSPVARIEMIRKATIIPGTAEEVDASTLDAQGRYEPLGPLLTQSGRCRSTNALASVCGLRLGPIGKKS